MRLEAVLEGLQQDALKRAQTALAAALVAEEVPGYLAAFRSRLEELRAELPAMEKRDQAAAVDLPKQEAKVKQLRAKLDATPDLLDQRSAHAEAQRALAIGERELQNAQTEASIAASRLKKQHVACQALEKKIAGLESLPAPDPAVLKVIRGR